MKKSRRVQLGFGLVTYAVCSFLWFRINTLEFLHYFPYDSEVNVLMWSYVCLLYCHSCSEHNLLPPECVPHLPIPDHSVEVPLHRSSFPLRSLKDLRAHLLHHHPIPVLLLLSLPYHQLLRLSEIGGIMGRTTSCSSVIRSPSSTSSWPILRTNCSLP